MRIKSGSFNAWLKGQLKSTAFRKAYEKEDVRARLALRIIELRRKKKMSQAQLARKLGTTQQVVSDVETFKHPNVTLVTLQRIADALDRRLVVELR
jgi:ribosome-binding protein aMBF1 (putative translation factor)